MQMKRGEVNKAEGIINKYMPADKTKTFISNILLLMMLSGLIILQGLFFRWDVIDDAYISFRYAVNLLDGNGLVFNQGEFVEGYTNFLWTMLMAGCGWIGFDIVKSGFYLSIFFACLTILLTWMVSRRVALERGWNTSLAWLPPLLLACYPGWSYWAFSGMEQPLLATLLLLFIYCGNTEKKPENMYFCLAVVFGLLAALTRWESVLIWPSIAFAQLYNNNRVIQKRFLRAAVLMSVLIFFFSCYFLWRFNYYNEFMPNTFYAKAGTPLPQRILWGLVYTGELAIEWWIPLSLVVWFRGWRKRWSCVLISTTLIYIIYVTWSGGDHFAWLRFYLPILPVAAIMLGEIIHHLQQETEAPFTRSPFGKLLLMCALATIIVGTSLRIDYRSAQKHHEYVRWWGKVGLWAKGAFPVEYTLAVIPAGVIPYVSGHPVLDLMGLTDYETAHFGQIDMTEAPGHQKSNISSVLRRKPKIILGEALPFSYPPNQTDVLKKTNRIMLRTLYRMPEFQQLYEFRTFKTDDTYSSFWILK